MDNWVGAAPEVQSVQARCTDVLQTLTSLALKEYDKKRDEKSKELDNFVSVR